MKMKIDDLAGTVTIFLLSLGFLLGGCSPGPRETVSVRRVENGKQIEMTAGNFYFNPAVIEAAPGDVLLIRIENTAGSEHDFTVENPAGDVILTTDLPAGDTREVEVQLAGPGTYRYYCDIRFHPTLGMTGRIEVR
jgi:plastocyanin